MSAPERSLAEHVGHWAAHKPDALAYAGDAGNLCWGEYDRRARVLAAALVGLGLARGERVAVLLPDGPGVHVAFLACETAGLVAVGIGPRAGLREIAHLLRVSGARALLCHPTHQEADMADFVRGLPHDASNVEHLLLARGELAGADELVVDGRVYALSSLAEDTHARLDGRGLRPDELFLLNSTSGTTGMPKCVTHDQRRWFAFHRFAVRTGALSGDDVFMSVVPAPFGFGIWTSHVTPTLLGVETVVMPRFDAERALALIEAHRVSVLAAVSTQFIMLLDSQAANRHDLGSLRVLYTGGERVPHERAVEFEERTGAAVLQFYGSNETGAVAGTALDDPREKRLTTAGRVIDEMNVRLFDDAGRDVTAAGRGQPGCKGPTLSRGYYGPAEEVEAANRALIREDGWMLLGDVVTIDAEGYLSVVGRTDDFIIRGGKNISGPAVEEQVATHPAVALAAAVAMPDPVFGERVCVFVELVPGAEPPDLRAITSHLAARDVSKENLPERLEILDALPRNSGGKIAKQVLRDRIRSLLASESRQRPS